MAISHDQQTSGEEKDNDIYEIVDNGVDEDEEENEDEDEVESGYLCLPSLE